jgi:hypothetical protein
MKNAERIDPRDIEGAYTTIESGKNELSKTAFGVVMGNADVTLIETLANDLFHMANILRMYHHAFDPLRDPRTENVNDPDLLIWASEYDPVFRDCHAVLVKHQN